MFTCSNHVNNINSYFDKEYDFNNLKEHDILYVKTDYIYKFSKIIDTLPCKFVLVTGCSDYTIPDDLFSQHNEFIAFIENDKIIKWFVQNSVVSHPKIINLPIGVDYQIMYDDYEYNKFARWLGPQQTPIEQEQLLISIKNVSAPFYERQLLIYSNCHFQMNTKFGTDRVNAISAIPPSLLFLEPSRINRRDSWLNQIKYSFVVSPHGNGLDCYRTWEALILGCIPIVKTSPIDILYEDLPVLIVNDWNEVTRDLLVDTIALFKTKQFNFDKLTLNYWMQLMRNCN
jgi:hypothetical protein